MIAVCEGCLNFSRPHQSAEQTAYLAVEFGGLGGDRGILGAEVCEPLETRSNGGHDWNSGGTLARRSGEGDYICVARVRLGLCGLSGAQRAEVKRANEKDSESETEKARTEIGLAPLVPSGDVAIDWGKKC